MSEMREAEAQGEDAEQIIERLNTLVEELELYPDTELRDKALDLVQLIMKLYGEALRRVLAEIDTVPLKDQILSRLVSDEVIRAMLLIHGLLPITLEDRVATALNHLRPILLSQGADVELLGIIDGRARMRLMRKGRGAPPIATLRVEIEKALSEAAPDLLGIEIEGIQDQIEATAKAAALLGRMITPARIDEPKQAQLIQIKRPQPDRESVSGTWVPVVRAIGFEEGHFKVISFGDVNLIVCRIGGEFYAYRNGCAEGDRPLDDALFESPMLTCTCHGYSYDLRLRGSCVERPELHLEPLPVIVEDEKVKVAL
jgi:nitrite reductase/ring-hydroxylating ferredoxin subunit